MSAKRTDGNSDGVREAPDPGARNPLRHPGVVAAIVTGVFGLTGILLKDVWAPSRPPAEPTTPSATQSAENPPPMLDASSAPVSVRLREIRRALSHEVDGQPDIELRLRALTELAVIGGEQPPEPFYQQAAGMLVDYIKHNIELRRRAGPHVEVDPRPPGAYRPADIVIALEGLQAVRRASGKRIEVSLSGIDFRQINLSNLDFEGFNFTHANFSHAHLSDCRCRGADFRHARFEGTATWGTGVEPADFREVRFDGATLAGSKWANVDFTGSNIEAATGHGECGLMADARGLTPAQRTLFP